MNGISDQFELTELAKKLNIHVDGIITIDEVAKKLRKNGTYIILLRPSNIGVGHWVAYNKGDYFDSFGEPPDMDIPAKRYNTFQYQGVEQNFCGWWCLLWLYSQQKNRSDVLEQFTDLAF